MTDNFFYKLFVQKKATDELEDNNLSQKNIHENGKFNSFLFIT